MRNLVGRILGFFMLAGLTKRDSLEGQVAEDSARGEIRAFANRLLAAVHEKALPELLDMMTDDVVLLAASGPPTVGRDAVKTLCTGLFVGFDISHHVDFGVSHFENAPIAIAKGGYFMTLRPLAGGSPASTRGRFVAVLRHENGAWKLARGFSLVSWVELT